MGSRDSRARKTSESLRRDVRLIFTSRVRTLGWGVDRMEMAVRVARREKLSEEI